MSEEENFILFHLTVNQAKSICNHYNKDINSLQDYEVTELLDKYIDELNK